MSNLMNLVQKKSCLPEQCHWKKQITLNQYNEELSVLKWR